MTDPVGMLEAVTGIIGEADGAIGGIPLTRLTAPVTDGVVLSATFTWAGTLTVLTADTSEVAAGDFIRLDVDGQYFEIDSLVPNTSVTLLNPQGLIIPTGTSQSSKAETVFPVETTLDFSDTGKISIDGIVYSYAGKTNQSFTGISHIINAVSIAGAARLHRIESVVYDRNRNRSALDLVRRAMLVEYAEGADLNALGRNLGVLRSAFLGSDDQFRQIVKVLAYNPKGTLYGLQLALEGLVGAGNFVIYEDPLNYPCRVFITLLSGAIVSDRSQGAAYLVDYYTVTATGGVLTLPYPVISRGIIREIIPSGGGSDLWAVSKTDGVVATGSRTLTSAALAFVAADVGRYFRTHSSAVTNAQGGNNNGTWIVESQTPTTVTLIGPTYTGVEVKGANPLRVELPEDVPLFQFPDDLGKEIEILDSSLGNNGVYVIDKLLDPVTLTDIEAGATPQPQKTRYCEVVAGSPFVSETDLSFRLRPNFQAESNLDWILQDAGTIVGDTVTLRETYTGNVDVFFSSLLTAQLLRDPGIQSVLTSEEPVEFSYYPFYLSDPLGYARDYLDSVTAAGVIPSFTLV